VRGQEEDDVMRLPALRLSKRDKRTLLLGGILVGALLLTFGWILPSLERIRILDRALAAERERLQQVRQLHRAILELKEQEREAQEQLTRRLSETFSVASVVEGMARESGIMEQVQYLKPEMAKVSEKYREASVSLKAGEITPEQLVDFLYRVESSERLLRIRNLQIRTSPKETGRLDVTLTIFTLMPSTAPAKTPEPEGPEPQGPDQ
jgi:type II secretory pathway component PulM